MGRKPCCEKEGLNRGAWTAQEDKILSDYIQACGEGKWNSLPRRAGLKRCGKSCRLRWLNYLRPDIKRGNITRDEEDLIVRLHKLLGNRWSLIAGRLPGRTDNEIKNYWNTNLSKKLELESTRKQPIITNSKQTQEKKTLTEVGDPAVHHSSKELAKSVPIKTTAFKCTKNFSLEEAHRQMTSSRPAGTGPNQDQPSSWPSDEASKGYFADLEARFGFSELDAVAGGGDVDGFFFRSTGGVQEVKETELADDFNFLNELLDSEGGWIGDL